MSLTVKLWVKHEQILRKFWVNYEENLNKFWAKFMYVVCKTLESYKQNSDKL